MGKQIARTLQQELTPNLSGDDEQEITAAAAAVTVLLGRLAESDEAMLHAATHPETFLRYALDHAGTRLRDLFKGAGGGCLRPHPPSGLRQTRVPGPWWADFDRVALIQVLDQLAHLVELVQQSADNSRRAVDLLEAAHRDVGLWSTLTNPHTAPKLTEHASTLSKAAQSRGLQQEAGALLSVAPGAGDQLASKRLADLRVEWGDRDTTAELQSRAHRATRTRRIVWFFRWRGVGMMGHWPSCGCGDVYPLFQSLKSDDAGRRTDTALDAHIFLRHHHPMVPRQIPGNGKERPKVYVCPVCGTKKTATRPPSCHGRIMIES